MWRHLWRQKTCRSIPARLRFKSFKSGGLQNTEIKSIETSKHSLNLSDSLRCSSNQYFSFSHAAGLVISFHFYIPLVLPAIAIANKPFTKLCELAGGAV